MSKHDYLHRIMGGAGGTSKAAERADKMATVTPKPAKTMNIEGNESAGYEKLEKKTLKTLKHGGSEAELRAGHNDATYKGKSMTPGGGGSFAKLKDKLAARGDVKNPAAVAAAIGRKKYGAKKMAQFSAAGRKRAAKG